MKKFNSREENYWRNTLLLFILIAVTVTLIVWFLPRNDSQQYRYDVNKPWMYGSYIAKFDQE